MYNIKGDLLVKRDLVVNNRSSSLLAVNIPNWQTAKSYLIGDTVYSNNILYKAITNHTSGTFSTDLAANQWLIVTPNTATSIVNTPAGNIAATTVQAALNELDAEKQAKIAFYEEGTIVGTSGQYNKINFIGATVTATQNGSDATQLDVTLTATSSSSITASSGGATYKYNVLTGTPTVSYSKSSGTGTLTATGGTIQLIRFDDVILDSDRDVNTDFKWVLVGTGTTELFAIPSNVSKRTLSATNTTSDASTNAVVSNQFDIDNTPNIKYGNLVLTGQGGITIRSNNIPAGNAGGNGYSFIW